MDPFFDPFYDPFIYEPALGWFRSAKGGLAGELANANKKKGKTKKNYQKKKNNQNGVQQKVKLGKNRKRLKEQIKGKRKMKTKFKRKRKRRTTKHPLNVEKQKHHIFTKQTSRYHHRISKSKYHNKPESRRRIRRTTKIMTRNLRQRKQIKGIQRGKRSAMTWEEIQAWRNSWGKKTTRLSFYHKMTSKPAVNFFDENQKSNKHKQMASKVDSSMDKTINSFLNSVIQTYGNGQAIKIPGGSAVKNVGNISKPKTPSIGAKIFRRLRKFSKKSVENMMKMSNLGKSLPLLNIQRPKSSKIPWATLKRVLTKGIRGPDVAR